MKILIAAINARFSHQGLAAWSLKANCPTAEITVRDYHINTPLHEIYADIMAENYNLVAFSCYIWNIELVKKLSTDLCSARPEVTILWGGPEVSFGTDKIMTDNLAVNFIIAGEGETAFANLVEYLEGERAIETVPNLYYRREREIIFTYSFQEDLDQLADPYTEEMLAAAKHRIIYFESSRGCDFRCTYCLSSLDTVPVRYLALPEIFFRLQKLMNQQVPLVKFVDRTFNRLPQRAGQIWEFLRQSASETTFHFEIAPDLLTAELLSTLKQFAPNQIQVECGIQSTFKPALKAVKRPADFTRIQTNINYLTQKTAVHTHLDLIVGLPYETLSDFRQSFNDVYQLKGDQLQVGFLKKLPGTQMPEYQDGDFRQYPPYEVIKTTWLSPKEILALKKIDFLVDTFYNSGLLRHTLAYLETCFVDAYGLYTFLGKMIVPRAAPVSNRDWFSRVFQFVSSAFAEDSVATDLIVLPDKEHLKECLRYDHFLQDLPALSGDLESPAFLREEIEKLLENSDIPTKKYRDFLRQYRFAYFRKSLEVPSRGEPSRSYYLLLCQRLDGSLSGISLP